MFISLKPVVLFYPSTVDCLYVLPSFGDVGAKNICLVSDIMELDGTEKNQQNCFFFRNHDLIIQANLQTLF